MRTFPAILAAMALGLPLASGGELNVKLNLTERAGVARQGEPVTGGVPLPAGAIKDISELAVLDAAGKPVPAQFAVLNRHWDVGGGPKWVLVSFQADLAAGGKATYTMKPEAFAERALALVDAGANILGGCCGTGPEFIAALKARLTKAGLLKA